MVLCFIGSEAGRTIEGTSEGGCWEEGGCYKRPLSIQSGDIVLPSTTPSLPHGRVYNKLFPIVHKAVRCVFLTERIPLCPLFILCGLFVLTIILGCVVWFKFPLTFNISVESVQVPDHVSSKHWDAYQAVLGQQIYNDGSSSSSSSASMTKDFSNTLLFPGSYGNEGGNEDGNDGAGETKSSEKGSSCCTIVSDTDYHQRTMHGSWIVELVYRGRDGKNLLENNRIAKLHEIEEHIYNLTSYKGVCHYYYKERVCDPINSILTYFYPRSYDDGTVGKFNENWKTDLDPSQLSSGDVEQILWYTGGQIGDDFTTPLLRAQVRGNRGFTF